MTESDMLKAASRLAYEWNAGNRQAVLTELTALPPLGAAYVAESLLRMLPSATQRVRLRLAMIENVKEVPWPTT